jgi:hypothetical protein
VANKDGTRAFKTFGDFMLKHMSLAAVMAPMAGVGYVWLAMGPLFTIMKEPIVGILPLVRRRGSLAIAEQPSALASSHRHADSRTSRTSDGGVPLR